jgi:hypothetical protein
MIFRFGWPLTSHRAFVDFAFDVTASADPNGKRSILLNQQMKVYFRCALPLTWFT